MPDESVHDRPTPARESEKETRPDPAAEETSADQHADAAAPTADRHRVRVHVLGPPCIHGYTPPRGHALRKKSLELLVYLAVHGGSATQDAITDDVLAYALRRTVDAQLHTNVYGLRRALKQAAGDAQHLSLTGNRYTLDADLVDVDLWRMQAAITQADKATDRATLIAALRRAVEQYRGTLAQDCQYEWVEPHREASRQQAIDTHRALAAELAAEIPDEALAVLDTAIRHNPYAEPPYQDAMRIHHQRGDLNGIRARHRDLTLRLKEIDTDPTDDTEKLAAQLIADLRHRASRRSSGANDAQ